MKRYIFAVAATLLCAIAGQAQAQTTSSGNLSVTAVVLPGCVVTTTPVLFGTYDPFSATPTNGVGTVVVVCATGTPTTSIDMGDGLHFLSGSRRMESALPAGNFLSYGLFQPPTSLPAAICVFPATIPWGALGNALSGLTSALGIGARVFNVCGTIPAGQTVPIGSYSDTVAVTVHF